MDNYGDPTLLEATYPRVPYNFDQAPPEYVVGPIKAILISTSATIRAYMTALALLATQVTIQTATGVYLDAHGVLYNTPRLPGEIDDAYRQRMLGALTIGKLTIPNIQKTVDNYLSSKTNKGGTTPVARVYDLQSNPQACAQDAANGNPIKMFQFVVELDISISENEIFFLNYSYLSSVPNDPLTLFEAGTSYSMTTPDSGLLAEINRVKAGNTRPIFKTVVATTR